MSGLQQWPAVMDEFQVGWKTLTSTGSSTACQYASVRSDRVWCSRCSAFVLYVCGDRVDAEGVHYTQSILRTWYVHRADVDAESAQNSRLSAVEERDSQRYQRYSTVTVMGDGDCDDDGDDDIWCCCCSEPCHTACHCRLSFRQPTMLMDVVGQQGGLTADTSQKYGMACWLTSK